MHKIKINFRRVPPARDREHRPAATCDWQHFRTPALQAALICPRNGDARDIHFAYKLIRFWTIKADFLHQWAEWKPGSESCLDRSGISALIGLEDPHLGNYKYSLCFPCPFRLEGMKTIPMGGIRPVHGRSITRGGRTCKRVPTRWIAAWTRWLA